jgi:CHAT domain
MSRPSTDRLDEYFAYIAAKCPPALQVWTAASASEFCDAVEKAIEAAILQIESNARSCSAMDERGLSWLLTSLLTAASIPAVCEGFDNGHVHVSVKHPADLPLLTLGACKIYKGYKHHHDACEQLLSQRSSGLFCLAFFRAPEMYTDLQSLRDQFNSRRPLSQSAEAAGHRIEGAFVTSHQHVTATTVRIVHLGCSVFSPSSSTSRRHTILFVTANHSDSNQLALDREARAIRVELERSGFRDRFELVTRWAMEPLDLLHELRRLNPTVVHFSGGVSDEHRSGLLFQGPDGRAQLVSTEALKQTFEAAGASVKVVVLSACYSEVQAEALLAHVDCVVGMDGVLHREVARSFARGFYGGLGGGASVAAAHKQGRAAIQLEGSLDSDSLLLKVRPGVDASQLILATDE